MAASAKQQNGWNTLSSAEKHVILNKGTEAPFSGKYWNTTDEGTYTCGQCNALLYMSEMKFNSHCGWPSFDDSVGSSVKETPDADGSRVEITCDNCGGHLGHVFRGEGFTAKDTRHCVNSLSVRFHPKAGEEKAEEPPKEHAVFAGGCFWGVEYLLQQANGVEKTACGYTGGHTPNPSYEDVCTGKSGHHEAVYVEFDPSRVSFEELAKLFFEIHDPTQATGQGPDIGEQYKSVVYYADEKQKATAEKLIGILKSKGLKVATMLKPATDFHEAEAYHQNYYFKKGSRPYCHRRVRRF